MMRMLSLALFAAGVFAVSGCAQTPPSQEAAAQAPSGEKQICRDEDAGSASRMGTMRVCHTQEEWNKLHGKSR